jgi:hypothetical protein
MSVIDLQVLSGHSGAPGAGRASSTLSPAAGAPAVPRSGAALDLNTE